MVKSKETPPSYSAYFEQLYAANPSWLDDSTNEQILRQWEKDHGNQPMPPNVRSIMANKKSKMREKLGKAIRHKRIAIANDTSLPVPRGRLSIRALESLEEQIDNCLDLARQQHHPEMECVIKHLRIARRGVVLAMGRDAGTE